MYLRNEQRGVVDQGSKYFLETATALYIRILVVYEEIIIYIKKNFVDGYALGEQTTGELPEKTFLPYYA